MCMCVCVGGGVSGGAMVLGHFQCRGVLPFLKIVGQGPTALAVDADGGGLDIFRSSIISLFFLPLSVRRPDI